MNYDKNEAWKSYRLDNQVKNILDSEPELSGIFIPKDQRDAFVSVYNNLKRVKVEKTAIMYEMSRLKRQVETDNKENN